MCNKDSYSPEETAGIARAYAGLISCAEHAKRMPRGSTTNFSEYMERIKILVSQIPSNVGDTMDPTPESLLEQISNHVEILKEH